MHNRSHRHRPAAARGIRRGPARRAGARCGLDAASAGRRAMIDYVMDLA
ncbi:MAG: hypothetical protein R2854_07625 [Caldilineaceae bacterium]